MTNKLSPEEMNALLHADNPVAALRTFMQRYLPELAPDVEERLQEWEAYLNEEAEDPGPRGFVNLQFDNNIIHGFRFAAPTDEPTKAPFSVRDGVTQFDVAALMPEPLKATMMIGGHPFGDAALWSETVQVLERIAKAEHADPRTDDLTVPLALETAEARVRLRAANEENTRLRASLATSQGACTYCQLPAADMAKCKSGFPGCARMDDMMGCPELGACLALRTIREAALPLGGWLSAALDEPSVCAEMKTDIQNWFASLPSAWFEITS